MQTRRRMAAGMAAATMSLVLTRQLRAAEGTDGSARAFLQQIYAHYTGANGSDGVDLSSEANIRKLFDPPLATLILADRQQSESNDIPPVLDGDPFVNAQDWDLDKLTITMVHADAARATAEVRFDSLGKSTLIRIDLLHLANGWRVHGIDYGSTTLARILSSAGSP
jgi:hypothetical protein